MKNLLFIFCAAITFSACTTSTSTPPKDEKMYSWINSEHVACGVPFDSDTSDDYIIVRDEYVLSYNNQRGAANWVAWKLTAASFGDVERYSGNFITDTSLPTPFQRIKHADYTNSGYDRGHMVRSEERTYSVEANKATFYMTNILPQTPDLNRGVWYDFEQYCQELCTQQHKDLYIIAGGIYDRNVTTLKDEGKVEIPDSCYKIVYIVDSGQKPTATTVQQIAVIMPNIAGVRKYKYSTYISTVPHIEQSTGYSMPLH